MDALKHEQRGFSVLLVVALIVALVAIGFAGFKVLNRSQNSAAPGQNLTSESSPSDQPNCSAAPTLQTPVDLTKVTGILYPGQYRGGQYKSHGGFRFDGSKTSDITVKAPLDGEINRASRYNEGGEVQILLEFNAACGYAYRFDHILKVAPAFQSLVDSLPQPTEDSRTTAIEPPFKVKAGDIIAVAVGFSKTNNVSVDFGVYDNNHKNNASEDPAWAAQHSQFPNDQYGLCWFDLLTSADATIVRNLPAADQTSGKTSDYCQ